MEQSPASSVQNEAPTPAGRIDNPTYSMGSVVWRRFRRHPGAIVGSVILGLLVVAAILAPLFERNNVLTIAIVIGGFGWMTFARLVRAAFLTLRELDFVSATRALGGRDLWIIVRHILPNAIGPIIVESTLELGYAIIEESGLSFLGFGIQPPTPSWGNLLGNAQEHFTKYPWLAIFPGLMIFLAIISVNYIGDGLRDAYDPYKIMEQVGER